MLTEDIAKTLAASFIHSPGAQPGGGQSHPQSPLKKKLSGKNNLFYRVHQKSIPLKNFAKFSRTIEIKFYKLITHSIIRKFVKFNYIIYRIDKITLLLVMGT